MNVVKLVCIFMFCLGVSSVQAGQNELGKAAADVKTKPSAKSAAGACTVASVYAYTDDNQIAENNVPASMNYLDDEVKETYVMMRNKVISHVKKEVILSMLKFSSDGFSPESLAAYVSEATKPFLPFKFANGVKIVGVTHQGKTIVYKAETPMHNNHNHEVLLTKVGITSAKDIVCNDKVLVEDLLERNVVIRYDYYDSHGAFICSFNIKDGVSAF